MPRGSGKEAYRQVGKAHPKLIEVLRTESKAKALTILSLASQAYNPLFEIESIQRNLENAVVYSTAIGQSTGGSQQSDLDEHSLQP